MLKAGVVALQGDVREHARALESAGATPVEVRYADELAAVDVLVMPGGESTTIGKLLDRFDLLGPLKDRVAGGMPLYGTCAGLILMANRLVGRDDAPHRLGVMDVAVERNAYGRQVDSFETDLTIDGLERPFRAVFIRAPIIDDPGPGVDVLASHEGAPVLVRQGTLWGSTFHPEMTGDNRVHAMFVDHARQVI
ncbi:MAG TPA: pyridoxal 5'-phosphate synthase glutaminase subunit PdxT [Actinomycetota bacterium]|nr:pyridoxal 5'-phosphate synthase glutaminase subunit PdxT [Actinomycetota bacterium]